MVYPDSYHDTIYSKNLNIVEEIEKRDIILLMITGRFLYKYDWGFIDRAFEAYTPDLEPDLLYNYQNSIGINFEFFDNLAISALKSSKSLQDFIAHHADYQFKTQNPDKYREIYGLQYYKEIIRHDTGWMNSIMHKAQLKNITVDSVLCLDADFMFSKEAPEIRKKYYAIQKNESLIRSNQAYMNQVAEKAKKYHLTLDEMILQEAMRLSNEETEKVEMEQSLAQNEKNIRNDKNWMKAEMEKAKKFGISLDEMIRRDAKWIYGQKKSKKN
jgi:hypothetical protein